MLEDNTKVNTDYIVSSRWRKWKVNQLC